MSYSTSSRSSAAVGFLTIVESGVHGIFGGYLILNHTGRPLEFHCTAPVRPNRAQEILYGPTLKPYIYGEQIAQTLVKQTKSVPNLVCTDVAEVMEVRHFAKFPVALLLAPTDPDCNRNDEIKDRFRNSDNFSIFEVGRFDLAVCGAHPQDRNSAIKSCNLLKNNFDLAEPFDRIRFAINEAQTKSAA